MKPTFKTLLFIFIVILAVLIVRAPASMIRQFVPAQTNVHLTNLEGTIWNGSANIYFNGQDIGLAKWKLRPEYFMSLALGYNWSLKNSGQNLDGFAKLSFKQITITANGLIKGILINRYLQPYELSITGDLTLNNVSVTVEQRTLTSCDGLVTWPGGTTRYRLTSRHYQAELPPLIGEFGLENNHPALTVSREGGEIPLIKAELLPTGFVKVGITKRFTQLLGNPWPGRDPDHAVVLEVEEQIFLK